MTSLEFRVYGTPIPQGSKTAFVRGGRAQVVDANKVSLSAWRQAVATAARDWQSDNGRKLLDEPLKAEIQFVFDRPKSVKRTHPSVKPDIDKLVRAVLDGITNVIIKDDSRVVALHAIKTYTDGDQPPGAWVRISTL